MGGGIEFYPYDGDLIGLCTDENHLVFRWDGPGKILFSVSRRGNAASIHFASNKQGLRYIKEAVDKFVEFVFWLFPWCIMVLGQVVRPSVGRMIEKIGFLPIARADDATIFMRVK